VTALTATPANAQILHQERDRAGVSAQSDEAPFNPRTLKFPGIHAVPLTSDRYPAETVASLGEFTVDGPRVETLRPLISTPMNVSHVAGNEVFFIGTRAELKTGTFTRFTEEAHGRRPQRSDFTAMAFDSRRGRFLLADSAHLYAYDPQTMHWLWRKENKSPLLGLAYDPDRDVFYGVVGENAGPRDMFLRERMAIERAQGQRRPVRNAPLTIRHFSADAVAIGETTASESLPPKPIPGAFQTTFSQGLIVLFTDHSLYAIRPSTGEVVYTGQTTLIRDGQPWEHGQTFSRSVEEWRDNLHKRIAALKGRLAVQKADDLAARLDYLSRCLQGEFSEQPGWDAPEIHAVGMYRVERPDDKSEAICPVTVSHAAAPLILIVSAHEATTWRFAIDSRVRVQQIILAGYGKHKTEGLPDGTPVLDRTALEQPQHYFYVAPPGRTAGARDGFASTAHAVFGSEPMTSQYDQSSYEIGPASEKWRTSYLESLVRDLERDVLVAENADLEFGAVLRRKVADVEDSAITSFSLEGPKDRKPEWLSKSYVMMTLSPGSADRYVVDRKSAIHVLQLSGVAQAIGPAADVIPGETTAIVYDRRRDRLLAWHSQESRWKTGNRIHGRVLMQFQSGTRVWAPVGGLAWEIGGVAYDQDQDLIYGFVLPKLTDAIRDLLVMNASGATLSAVTLSPPFYWDRAAGPPQAVFARGHLIVITPPQAVLLPDDKERLVSQIITINPATGQTYFTGRYFCD
jgi:hypothetical protein